MTDPRLDVRENALDKILQARAEALEDTSGKVRYNIIPTLNFKAKYYWEMIDWTSVSITSPPVLRNISNEKLVAKLSDQKCSPEWEFNKFPCHTVAVERMVKLVTEASAKVYGQDSRDRYIRSTLQSRAALPKFDNKAQYKSAFNSDESE